MINVHFSLLPRWRGAAPVERAILAGDTETGVCIMQLEEGLDTGPVYAVERVAIGPDDSADELRGRLVDVGTRLLVGLLASGLPEPVAQEGEATYAAKIEAGELQIDWAKPAVEIHRLTRLGRAWTIFRGKRLKVLRARLSDDGALAAGMIDGVRVGTGDGAIELVAVQPEGKGIQDAQAWKNGAHLQPGDHLGG